MDLNEIYKSVADDLNLPIELVKNTYLSYWKYIRKNIKELPLKKKNLTEEEFNTLKTNFNIGSIGKLYTSWEKYSNQLKKLEYIKKIKDDKAKENKTTI